MPVFGLIGGSGLLKSKLAIFASLTAQHVPTAAGTVIFHVGTIPDTDTTLVFCQRHAASPSSPYSQPHEVNYAAIMLGMVHYRADVVVAIASVGTLHPERIPCGSLVVPTDFFCPADLRPVYADARGHFVPTFNDALRKEVLDVVYGIGLRPLDGGVYVNTKGPRFETRAEIRFFATVGDILGMTAAHEASAAMELKLPYAILGIVDNVCNGLLNPHAAATEELSLAAFHRAQADNLAAVEAAVDALIKHFGAKLSAPAEPHHDKTRVDLMVHARYVVPVEPEGVVLDNYSVVVKDGIIVELLPHDAAREKYIAKDEQFLGEHCVMPGMVNAHTHVSMNLLRGLADDLPLIDWLTKEMWPTERRLVSPEFCKAGSRHAIAEMLRGGTTCFNDMYFYPDATAEVVIASGIRAALALVVFVFPTAWASSTDEYFTKGKEVVAKYSSCDRLSFTIGPHAPYTVDDAAFERVKQWSEESGLRVHTHLHETAGECVDSAEGIDSLVRHKSETCCRPFQNLDRIGLLNERLIAAHMTQLTDEEIERLAASGASVIHCPTSNLKLGCGFCPVAKLMAAGVNLCIGTDSSASNNCLDMMSELKLAAVLAKGVSGITTAVPASQALRMATLNGAKALGLDKKIGSLVAGKSADMIAVHLEQLELAPLYSVISHLVYAVGRENITDVWVAGKQLMGNRRLLTLDEASVIKEARFWGTRAATKAE